MTEAPEVKPYDFIRIGIRRAIISRVYGLGHVEVVYLDDRDQPINEDAIWESGKWRFKSSSLAGGYADNSDRLRDFIRCLRHS